MLIAWTDEVTAIADAVTALTVVIGGGWVYFKFVRGRTFAQRAEVGIGLESIAHPQIHGVLATVSIKNTGSSRLPLVEGSHVEIFAIELAKWPASTNVVWGDPVILTPILELHEWIESGESLVECIAIPLPTIGRGGSPLAGLMARAHLFCRGRRGPRIVSAQTVHILLDEFSRKEPTHAA